MTAPEVTADLLRVPVRLYERASEHYADLLRELNLISLSDTADIPGRLRRIVDDLTERFATIGSDLGAREVDRIDLSVQTRPAAGENAAELLVLLHEVDVYCSGNWLITLPAPPDQAAFFTWYLGEFVRQTRGEPARAWPGALT